MSPDWDGVRGISIDIEEGFVSARAFSVQNKNNSTNETHSG